MKQYFSISNWKEFQHYKDRNPPWIKLHNQLLDNYEFEQLTDATKGHLLCIWMLASRTNNKLPLDQSWIKRKIGANSPVDLKTLESSGFIELQDMEHDASKPLVSEEERRDREEKSITKEVDYTCTRMSESEYTEICRIRKKNKGGSITQRVINGLSIEFDKARKVGMTNDQILTEWETRGWKSFKAEWIKSNHSNNQDFSDTSTDWVNQDHGVII